MPEVSKIAKAIAVFDAKAQLLAYGWDLESVQSLTWVVDAHPAEADDVRGVTFTAHFVDTRASTIGELEAHAIKASDGDEVVINPPPMPADREQYWTSVTLRTGALTLSVSVDPSELRGDDRALFSGMVRRMSAYERKAARGEASR